MSIKIKNLTHIYAKGLPYETLALDDVSFSIEDGTFLGVVGHTGSGKSTLLQHFNGLAKATSGSIFLDDIEITKEDISLLDVRKMVGLVFQYPEYQLFEETIEKDIAFGPKNLGLDEADITDRVREAMELVGLSYEKFKDKSPFELSGGQKRRVAIAGVLAMKPKVLILDEPTAGLDPQSHKAILNMLYDIHKRNEGITIFVSHNMNDIAEYCDQVIVMDKGKLVADGTPQEVFAKSEYLNSIGLDLPEVVNIAEKINELDSSFDKAIFDIDALEEALVKKLQGGQ